MASLGINNHKILIPQPSQVMTVYTKQGQPINITLDGGATGSFIKLSCAKKYGFKIWPNKQSAGLADNQTKVQSVGYIEEKFYRDNWSVTFKGLVVPHLKADIYGGTPFLKDNDIIQRPAKNIITVLGKHTIMQTNSDLPLSDPNSAALVTLAKINVQQTVLYPGQSIKVHTPSITNQTPVAVEPRLENKLSNWPEPAILSNNDSYISITNNDDVPIILNDDVKMISVTPCTEVNAATIQTTPHTTCNLPSRQNIINQINSQTNTSILSKQQIIQLENIHKENSAVFDGQLTGYNGHCGKHFVRLQWADDTRPKTTKVYTPNWSSAKDKILQLKIDQLTEMGVLADPYEHNIQVKCIHPCFLQKKARAAHKEIEHCEISEIRFLTAANAVNEKCRLIQTKIPDQTEIFRFIAKNPCAIYADLYESFFQNHLHKQDWGYMAINSPYKGLRVYTRSTQGLINQDEELNQLLSKVLGQQLLEGKCMKIADDLVVGGQTIQEAINNWNEVLTQLRLSNLKLSPTKVRIFPTEASIYGWQIKGDKITPDPHRQLLLGKTSFNDLKTISDLRSWMGIFKTFLIAMPGLAQIMDPFDRIVAGVKDNKSAVQWTDELINFFNTATSKIQNNVQYLTLPKPHEQLIIMPDATVRHPAVGFVLNVVRNDKLLPVIFYSFKLTDNQKDWWPCEREALAVATAIKKCSHYILESTKPTLVLTDSKPVVQAAALINKGKFSASSRMSAFLCSLARYKIDVQHVSGKLKQNIAPDFLSRNPAQCSDNKCQLCLFIKETSSCVVSAINTSTISNENFTVNKYSKTDNLHQVTFQGDQITLSAISSDSMPIGNHKIWSELQAKDYACREAYTRLISGQQPAKKGPMSNDIRRYYNTCQAKDLLVLEEKIPHTTQTRYRVVIPKPYVPAIIAQLHHREQNHPSAFQLEKIFNRFYFGINVKSIIEDTIANCMLCKSNKFLKPTNAPFNSVSNPSHPGQIFNADVIRRCNQKILICRDLFSSYTTAVIIKTEQSTCLLNGLIQATAHIRSPNEINIRTDSAPGFKGLQNNEQLKKLKINLETTDHSNNNAIATVDCAIKEFEEELIKLAPHATTLNEATIQLVINSMNSKIRNRGLTPYEIMFSRDFKSQTNLHIQDESLAAEQQILKKINHDSSVKSKGIITPADQLFNKGDTVAIVSEKNKIHSRDVYLVTDTYPDKLQVNKIIRYHSETPKFQSKPRIVPKNAVFHLSHGIKQPKLGPPSKPKPFPSKAKVPVWSPYNHKTNPTFDSDDSDQEDNRTNISPPITSSENSTSGNPPSPPTQDGNSPEQDNAQDFHDDFYTPFRDWEISQRRSARASLNNFIWDYSNNELSDTSANVQHDNVCNSNNITEGNNDNQTINLNEVQMVGDILDRIQEDINLVSTNQVQNLNHVLPIPDTVFPNTKNKRISPPRQELPLERKLRQKQNINYKC